MLEKKKCPACGEMFSDIPEWCEEQPEVFSNTFCGACRDKIINPSMPIDFVKVLGERIARLEARVKELEGKKS